MPLKLHSAARLHAVVGVVDEKGIYHYRLRDSGRWERWEDTGLGWYEVPRWR